MHKHAARKLLADLLKSSSDQKRSIRSVSCERSSSPPQLRMVYTLSAFKCWAGAVNFDRTCRYSLEKQWYFNGVLKRASNLLTSGRKCIWDCVQVERNHPKGLGLSDFAYFHLKKMVLIHFSTRVSAFKKQGRRSRPAGPSVGRNKCCHRYTVSNLPRESIVRAEVS